MLKNILIVALSALSFVGCGIYSKFESPTKEELPQVDSLYNYIEASADTTSLASLSWRELFTDAKLQSLIDQALTNNVDLQVAHLNVEQSQIALRRAKLALLPSLSLTPSGTLKSSGDTYFLGGSASWEVDLFGKLRNSKAQSRAALEASRAYAQAVQTELIATIASSYYTLLTLDRQLEITLKTDELWGESLRMTESLMRAGRVNRASVLQSEANKIALRASVASLEQQIREVEISLSTLLAMPAHNIERGDLSDLTLPEHISVGLPMQLVSRRPDVRVAEYNLAEAFYAVGEARSSLYPSLTISGSVGYEPSDLIYSAVASLVQPLFSRGTLKAQLRISQSQQEQAMLSFTQALVEAGAEVNSALLQWSSAREILGYDSAEIEVLQRAVKSTELLMRSGQATYLEVLTAQQSLLQSEISYSNNRYTEIHSVIELYRSLGGGVE